MKDKKDIDLENSERDKYNYLFSEHGFAKDPGRTHHIELMTTDLGIFSETYVDILNDCKLLPNRRATLLEIGIGPGTFMDWFFKQHNIMPYGVDISDEIVQYAKELFPNLSKNMLVGNAINLPYEDNYFDIVQHLDGMEHIPAIWEEQCLKEATRVSQRYIIYNNACGNATADAWAVGGGFSKAHINVKTPQDWHDFYEKYSKIYNYRIVEEFGLKKNNLPPHKAGQYCVILELIYEEI